ncbi:MAG TPA: Holliday junction resolvase RuvX [Candidatus Woesebacteria bacterium]|nr:Holliday junction resolvase RuvX [Candidatus Woesebacteria bacterium]
MQNNILAMDFGTKRIGVAISYGSLAEPLMVIEYNQLDEAIAQIQELCVKHQISLIVIGLSESQMAVQTKQFGEKIIHTCQLPVDYVDETLSSKQVRNIFKDNKKHLNGPIDHLSASIILEEWLFAHNQGK